MLGSYRFGLLGPPTPLSSSSLDFGQAFPSLHREYMMEVLTTLKLPQFFFALVSFLCAAIDGEASVQGALVALYWAR
eukprot:829163-Pyramimonas_sp.AAC.1